MCLSLNCLQTCYIFFSTFVYITLVNRSVICRWNYRCLYFSPGSRVHFLLNHSCVVFFILVFTSFLFLLFLRTLRRITFVTVRALFLFRLAASRVCYFHSVLQFQSTCQLSFVRASVDTFCPDAPSNLHAVSFSKSSFANFPGTIARSGGRDAERPRRGSQLHTLLSYSTVEELFQSRAAAGGGGV